METGNVDGIKVGTPASYSPYTDVYPGVVVRVTPKTVTVQPVEHGANRCVWPDQDFPIYLDQPVGSPIVFRRTKRGYKSSSGYRASFGHARYYQDPHF